MYFTMEKIAFITVFKKDTVEKIVSFCWHFRFTPEGVVRDRNQAKY